MTDTISDLLTRINNARGAGIKNLNLGFSNFKIAILEILKKEGYINNYSVSEDKRTIEVTVQGVKSFTGIKKISKPSRRKYASAREIPRSRTGSGLVIVSTSRGVISDSQARKKNIGGEIICEVY